MTYKLNKNLVSAGLLMIGDEILSGRTKDENLHFLAQNLAEIGINLNEVRIVLDRRQDIIDAVNALRIRYDYVFTSGGIGPTHDDITSEAIAAAFGKKLEKNLEAEEILHKFYGKNAVNEARLKMAYVPQGSKLLDNPVSSAPGFQVENVFVMAGVPKIFQAMFFAAKKILVGGAKTHSKEIKTNLTESIIAKDLRTIQDQFPEISIGSYPFEGGTSLVFRSIYPEKIDEAANKMAIFIESIRKPTPTEQKN